MDHPDRSDNDRNQERRKRVFVGKLPTDFLRLDNAECHSPVSQELTPEAKAALAMLNYRGGIGVDESVIGTLKVNIVQAKLVKNYGITRMDPYVIMRVGQYVYETKVDLNGGKNPKWNKHVECRLAAGVHRMNLKIYDECSLKVDELIAWAEIEIPHGVLRGEPCDDWFPLSGRQGERVEGMINLILNFTPGHIEEFDEFGPIGTFVMRYPVEGDKGHSSASSASAPHLERTILYFVRDLEQVEEMFPNIDKEVVRSVFECNSGNKDLTVNALLKISR